MVWGERGISHRISESHLGHSDSSVNLLPHRQKKTGQERSVATGQRCIGAPRAAFIGGRGLLPCCSPRVFISVGTMLPQGPSSGLHKATAMLARETLHLFLLFVLLKKKAHWGCTRGSKPLVTGQLFITSLEYLPDCIRFYCVFTWRADLRSQFGSWDREEKRAFRDHSGS